MKARLRKIVGAMAVVCIFLGVIPMLVSSFLVDTSWHGFGVDAAGNVYVGKTGEIRVYRDGELADTIDIPNYRYYAMAVRGDKLVLAGDGDVDTFTLEGEKVDETPDHGADIYEQMKKNSSVVKAGGVIYKVNNRFFRRTIRTDTGVLVYQAPVEEVVCSVGSAVFGVGYWTWVIMYFVNSRKKE